MDANILFIERCSQLDKLLTSSKEIELLDLAGVLRQLLVDGTPLVHKVNKFGLKLKFAVGEFRQAADKYSDLVILEDGLDPQSRPPNSPFKVVDVKGLLAHKVMVINGHGQSVADVIKFAANVAGGIHHGKPKMSQKALAEISAQFWIGGLPAGIRQLKAIGRVVLRGLAPLISAVENAK